MCVWRDENELVTWKVELANTNPSGRSFSRIDTHSFAVFNVFWRSLRTISRFTSKCRLVKNLTYEWHASQRMKHQAQQWSLSVQPFDTLGLENRLLVFPFLSFSLVTWKLPKWRAWRDESHKIFVKTMWWGISCKRKKGHDWKMIYTWEKQYMSQLSSTCSTRAISKG